MRVGVLSLKMLFLILLAIALVLVGGIVYLYETTGVIPVNSTTVQIASGGKNYPSYLAVPQEEGKFPAIVLIHSFNGLELGYKVMVDNFASQGFVVIAPEWQTFESSPRDEVVMQLVSDSVAFLKTQSEVNSSMLGLTGFCAGGRYTMLLLPQMTAFKSGVAWYGFPYSAGTYNQSKPVDYVSHLNVPMLIIHGTRDQASNITDIYRYATTLDDAGKYFEMKVYQGEPHGFMVQNGQLSQSFPAKDAFWQMVTFFNRTLK